MTTRTVEELEALLAIRTQELEQAKEQMVWRVGSASELSTLLRTMLTWAQADRHKHGDGPSGGYRMRCDDAERALNLWLTAEAALHARTQELEARAEAAESRLASLLPHVRHASECWFRGCTSDEAVAVEAEYPGGRKHSCTCGLSALLVQPGEPKP